MPSITTLPAALAALVAGVPTAQAGLPAPAGATYRVVATSGQPAPGAGDYFYFGAPSLSENGRVAFKALTSGGSGLWSDAAGPLGQLEAVGVDGAEVPGFPGTTFDGFLTVTSTFSMNASGEMSVGARLEGVQAQFGDSALFRYGPGGLEPVAVPGQLAPLACGGAGCTPWIEDVLTLAAINAQGDIAYTATLAGAGVGEANDTGVFFDGPGGPEALFREGDGAPGFAIDFGDAWWSLARLNDAGETIMRNFLIDGAGGEYWSLWRRDAGGLDAVAVQTWSTPIGGTFAGDDQYSYSLNNAGQAVFGQAVQIDGEQRSGIWLFNGVDIEAVAVEGEPAPLTFTAYDLPYMSTGQINADGAAVFTSRIVGFNVDESNNEAIFLRHPDGTMDVVARTGDQAPGLPPGIVYGLLHNYPPVLTNSGRVVHRARLAGPGVDEHNDDTLWVTRPGGPPALLIREGDPIPVDGALRVVDSFKRSGGAGPESGLRGGVTEHGQAALSVMFEDFTDAIIVATPEPLCPGDVNDDGVIDSADLNILLAGFGHLGEPGEPGDLDLDGDIDSTDLNAVLANFGEICLFQV